MSPNTKLLVLAVLVGVLGYVSYVTFWQKPEAPAGAGAASAAAAADELAKCPNGTIACPNNCLKREAEGWHSMHADGHPDTDIWMSFKEGRRTSSFNQHHIGHVIEPVDGKYIDKGVCPVCGGKTKVCR